MRITLLACAILLCVLALLDGTVLGNPPPDSDNDGIPDAYDAAPYDANNTNLNSTFWDQYKATGALGTSNGGISKDIMSGSYESYDCADTAILLFKKFCVTTQGCS